MDWVRLGRKTIEYTLKLIAKYHFPFTIVYDEDYLSTKLFVIHA